MGNLVADVRRLFAEFRRRGTLRTVRLVYHVLSDRWWEGRLGISTMRRVSLTSLGIDDPDYNDYVATPYCDIGRALRLLRVREQTDVFVDLGSGKGRVVLVAAQLAFKRVIGGRSLPSSTPRPRGISREHRASSSARTSSS